jgi:hypothetical protein
MQPQEIGGEDRRHGAESIRSAAVTPIDWRGD